MAKQKTKTDFLEQLRTIQTKGNKYSIEAYKFVFESLEFTMSRIGERRHVTGKELLEGIKHYAIGQFGLMAKTILNIWGVHSTDDFGKIVFNLVEAKLMGKTDEDSLEDFKDYYDFYQVFWKEPLKKRIKDIIKNNDS
jgi:uncharacterized repeat protein (TIGR04138 family)